MRTRTEIAPGVYRFNDETFYAEEVGVYLVELDDRIVLIDVPAFKPESFEFIHTPGHSDGSVCILDPKTGALFTGDTLAANTSGKIRDILKGSSHDADSVQRFQSVQRLSSERFDIMLPFHYSPLLQNAAEELRLYLARSSVRSIGDRTAL